MLERTARAKEIDQRVAEGINTTADEPGARPSRPLCETGNPIARQFDRPKPCRIGKRPQRDDAERGAGIGDSATKLQEIDIKPRISVEQEEAVVEQVAGMP